MPLPFLSLLPSRFGGAHLDSPASSNIPTFGLARLSWERRVDLIVEKLVGVARNEECFGEVFRMLSETPDMAGQPRRVAADIAARVRALGELDRHAVARALDDNRQRLRSLVDAKTVASESKAVRQGTACAQAAAAFLDSIRAAVGSPASAGTGSVQAFDANAYRTALSEFVSTIGRCSGDDEVADAFAALMSATGAAHALADGELDHYHAAMQDVAAAMDSQQLERVAAWIGAQRDAVHARQLPTSNKERPDTTTLLAGTRFPRDYAMRELAKLEHFVQRQARQLTSLAEGRENCPAERALTVLQHGCAVLGRDIAAIQRAATPEAQAVLRDGASRHVAMLAAVADSQPSSSKQSGRPAFATKVEAVHLRLMPILDKGLHSAHEGVAEASRRCAQDVADLLQGLGEAQAGSSADIAKGLDVVDARIERCRSEWLALSDATMTAIDKILPADSWTDVPVLVQSLRSSSPASRAPAADAIAGLASQLHLLNDIERCDGPPLRTLPLLQLRVAAMLRHGGHLLEEGQLRALEACDGLGLSLKDGCRHARALRDAVHQCVSSEDPRAFVGSLRKLATSQFELYRLTRKVAGVDAPDDWRSDVLNDMEQTIADGIAQLSTRDQARLASRLGRKEFPAIGSALAIESDRAQGNLNPVAEGGGPPQWDRTVMLAGMRWAFDALATHARGAAGIMPSPVQPATPKTVSKGIAAMLQDVVAAVPAGRDPGPPETPAPVNTAAEPVLGLASTQDLRNRLKDSANAGDRPLPPKANEIEPVLNRTFDRPMLRRGSPFHPVRHMAEWEAVRQQLFTIGARDIRQQVFDVLRQLSSSISRTSDDGADPAIATTDDDRSEAGAFDTQVFNSVTNDDDTAYEAALHHTVLGDIAGDTANRMTGLLKWAKEAIEFGEQAISEWNQDHAEGENVFHRYPDAYVGLVLVHHALANSGNHVLGAAEIATIGRFMATSEWTIDGVNQMNTLLTLSTRYTLNELEEGQRADMTQQRDALLERLDVVLTAFDDERRTASFTLHPRTFAGRQADHGNTKR